GWLSVRRLRWCCGRSPRSGTTSRRWPRCRRQECDRVLPSPGGCRPISSARWPTECSLATAAPPAPAEPSPCTLLLPEPNVVPCTALRCGAHVRHTSLAATTAPPESSSGRFRPSRLANSSDSCSTRAAILQRRCGFAHSAHRLYPADIRPQDLRRGVPAPVWPRSEEH